MRILVVDDEPMIAHTLSLIFRRQGFDVTTAGDADQAMESVKSKCPDLVLCDIDLPGRDGVALMQELSAERPELPILVLTGSYSTLARVQACAGKLPQSVGICTKPCPPADLIAAAGQMLRHRQMAS